MTFLELGGRIKKLNAQIALEKFEKVILGNDYVARAKYLRTTPLCQIRADAEKHHGQPLLITYDNPATGKVTGYRLRSYLGLHAENIESRHE